MTNKESPGQIKYKKYLKPALDARCVKELKAKGFKITHPNGLKPPTYTPVGQRKANKEAKKTKKAKKETKKETKKAKESVSLKNMFGF